MSYQYWSIIGLVCSMVFLVCELFLPSAGILGVIAFVLVVASIISGFMANLYFGAALVLLVAVATPFLFVTAVRIWPHTPIGRRILIGDRHQDDLLPSGEHYTRIADQVGRVGTAKTKMYPSGIVVIDGQQFDAVSNGFPIEAGNRIKVTQTHGNRLHVQKIDDDDFQSALHGGEDSKNDELNQTMQDLGIEDFDLGTPES